MKKNIALFLSMLLVISVMTGCRNKESARLPDDNSVHQKIGKNGAEMTLSDIAMLNIKTGALSQNADITLRIINYDEISDFMPENLKPVSSIIEVTIDPESALEDSIELNITYKENQNQIQALSIDRNNKDYQNYDCQYGRHGS